MWIRTLALSIALLCTQASARAHRGPSVWCKNFPATQDSVLLENQAGDAMGAPRYFTQEQVDEAVYAGKLSALYDHNYYRVSPKLPVERRYALPATVSFVEQLSQEFYAQFRMYLLIDSAIRPANVQRRLIRWNHSAAPWDGPRASSHLRGTTVDFSKHLTKAQYRWLVIKLMYYRAIGRVLVIEEKACLHVFVKGDYGNY